MAKGNIEGEWKHDLFEQNDVEEEATTDRPANRRPNVRKNVGGGRNESGAKVELENLEFSIDDQSLKVTFHFPLCIYFLGNCRRSR